MFRARQPMYLSPAGEVVFERLQSNERGEFDFVTVNDSRTVLPDVETTDLKQLIAAGIDPKRVDTRILAGNRIITDLSVEDENNDDNNNEENKEA